MSGRKKKPRATWRQLLPSRQISMVYALVAACLLTSLGIIQSTHGARMLYTELEQRESQAWALEENWSRLLLEHSIWAAHHRVERLAREKLDMRVPEFADIQLVTP